MAQATTKEVLSIARSRAKEALGASPSFHKLSKSDQMGVYRDTVNTELERLKSEGNLTKQMADPRFDNRNIATASNNRIKKRPGLGDENIIDNDSFNNKNMDQMGDRAKDILDAVDFPDFVSDLLTGVFDANVKANIDQMEAYQQMLKSATKSLSEYIKNISPEQSFAYLAENNSDEFGLSFPDMDDEGGDQILLTDKDGNPVDTEDTKIKAKIMDAQIAMAKEQRTLLKESVLMGVQRLVVEEGTIEAGLNISISSKANVTRTEKGRVAQERKNNSFHIGGGGNRGHRGRGVMGAGFMASKGQKSQVRVASAAGVQNDSAKADISGKVVIKFKTDYFKLDNFAKALGVSEDDKDEAGKAN